MYKIVGADQKEYGPVTAEQIKDWIAQGRANAQTIARLEPDGAWKALITFPEFATLFPAASAGPAIPPPLTHTTVPPAAGAPVFAAPRPYVPNHLVWSILATACCCLPTGIVAIVYSAQVNGKLDRGDLEGAQRSADAARNWCLASVVLFFLSNAVVGIFWRPMLTNFNFPH